MPRIAETIILTEKERTIINEWAKSKTLPIRIVQRARIIQMATQNYENIQIASKLGMSHPTVQLWRDRFLSFRLPGLEKDASASGPYTES
jgi:DNA-binding CsgD family transcriptional regulator